jgi:transcriptional regulator with XRE-family HTH domain
VAATTSSLGMVAMAPSIEPEMTPAERIKLFRRRAGLTQEQAAQLKGCTVSAWRKWEAGERQVTSLSDWIEIARILRVNDLYKLTGLPVAQLPDEPAEHETVPPIRGALHAYAPRLDGPVDLARLTRSVEFAWNTWHGSGSRYSRTGPMLPGLIVETRATLAAVDEADRCAAYRVAAVMYELVRAYAKRIGSLDLAAVAADRGMACADAADDPVYRAAAAWNVANVLSTQGHPETAAELCRDAIVELERLDGEDPTRLALLGSLHLLLAVQVARTRDERRAIDALSAAEHAAAVVGETNHHRLVFGPTNVGIHRSAVALELSRPSEALRVAERLDVSGSPSIERRHAHYLGLARSYSGQRDDLAAVHMLARADRECPEESRLNLGFRATVRDLLSRETPTTRPELRPLADRIGVA